MTSEPWQVPDPAGRANEERSVDVDAREEAAHSESIDAAPDAVEGAVDVQEQVEPPD